MAKKIDANPSPSESPAEEMMGKFPKYKVQSAMNTIVDAHQHMQNPDMMSQVKKLSKLHGKAIKAIQQSSDAEDASEGPEVGPPDAEDQAEGAEPPKATSIKKLRAIHAKKFGPKNI